MFKKCPLLYIVLFLLLSKADLFAQSFLPVCKNFNSSDYTENVEFCSAVSDNKGTNYFGTNYGVLIYRGEKKLSEKNWEIMLLPEPDVVLSLYLDTITNRLYAGTRHDFGYFELSAYNDGVFVSIGKKITGYKESLETWHIFKQNSKIIFHTLKALFTYDEAGKTEIIKSPEEGIFHNVFVIENCLLINSLERGWYIYKDKLSPLSNFMSSDKCYSVLALPEKNKYLLFFRNAGVKKVNLNGTNFSSIQTVSDAAFDKMLSENQVYGAALSADGKKIILATLGKGALLVENREPFTMGNILSETQDATNVMSAYGLYTDPLKNIWILGKSNLSSLPSDLSLTHKDFKGITLKGLCKAYEKLYVAAANGLYCMETQNGFFSASTKLADGDFTGVLFVNDTLYAYTSNEVTFVTKTKTGHFPSPYPINSIDNINNRALISCNGGLYVGLQNMIKDLPAFDGQNYLKSVCTKGSVYVLAADHALLHFDLSLKLLSEYALNNEFTSTQNARLFDTPEGLLISNLKSTYVIRGEKIVLETKNNTSRVWLYKAMPNDAWIKFEYGNSDVTALKLSKKNGPFVNANAFMSLTEVNDVAFLNGYYYLATKNGLCISKLTTDKPVETVHIFKLVADSLTFYANQKISIPYEKSKSIHVYCALNSFYSSFENTLYSYKLSNYNESWINQYTSNFSFSHLSWGDYTLEVRANYGNDEETPLAVLHFTILKPWWASWWGIFLWILIFVLFIYLVVQISVYRLKKSKIKLEHIVHERTQEIVAQKNEIENQKEEIEDKNREITDSINYAQHIQSSLLKGEAKLKSTLPGAFVLYMPKDIVSGDFYWFTDILDYHVIAVADCTGHGVPGAFMSMLGVAKLNELAAKNIFMPHELLHQLNHLIVETLGQNMANSDSRDGMDAAVVCIDKKNKKLFYAGANRSLLIFNKDENTFTEIKPTKLPVGGGQYGENRDYLLHELTLAGNMTIYLSTDGYADQFGGPKGKKYITHQMHDLLKKIAFLSPSNQKIKLTESYLAWRGKLEQVDDVCVIGIDFTKS